MSITPLFTTASNFEKNFIKLTSQSVPSLPQKQTFVKPPQKGVIHIVQKKQKKSWNKAHEFKRKKSTRRQVGHPSYIYAKRGRDYKYLTFTHTPENETDYIKLKYNIDPNEKVVPTYMKKQYGISRSSSFDPPDKKYRIHKADKETVKKYQK